MRYANSLIIVMQNHKFLVPLQQKKYGFNVHVPYIR